MFVFAEHLYFLAPAIPYESMKRAADCFQYNDFVEAETGRTFRFVYAFSDEDLAWRFIDANRPNTDYLRPLRMRDDATAILALEALLELEYPTLGVDFTPGRDDHTFLPTAGVLEHFRRRAGQGGRGPYPG